MTNVYIYMHITSDAQAVAHYLLTCPVSLQASERSLVNSHPCQKHSFCMMLCGMEHPFVQLKSAVLILFWPSSLCSPHARKTLRETEKTKVSLAL